jgi:hypothetical protein
MSSAQNPPRSARSWLNPEVKGEGANYACQSYLLFGRRIVLVLLG